EELADLIMEELDARGVAVVLEATHTCMTIRGVKKEESVCTTSAMRGGFLIHPTTRAELMSLIYGRRWAHAGHLLPEPRTRAGCIIADPQAYPSIPALLSHPVPGDPRIAGGGIVFRLADGRDCVADLACGRHGSVLPGIGRLDAGRSAGRSH